MGGKNAVIVDSDADLDEATIDTVYSLSAIRARNAPPARA
jgi:acyl-CoA reductase-like NAD-dependent aldehyde dehydrogenase